MDKIKTSIYINENIVKTIDLLKLDLNEIINKALDDWVCNNPKVEIVKIEKDILELQKKLEHLKLNSEKVVETINSELTQNEINFFIETIDLLKRSPTFLDGRKRLYNNTFAKDINVAEFKRLIDDFKKRRGF